MLLLSLHTGSADEYGYVLCLLRRLRHSSNDVVRLAWSDAKAKPKVQQAYADA